MVKKGRGSFPVKKINRPSPVANIAKIGSLMRYPDCEYANSLLHDAVKELAPLIHEYGFKVGLVCEMFPKSPNLLGLNVNKGQKIMLRLRYHHNDRLFLPMCDIIGTFLHELTHNVHGPHDKQFYDYLNKLERRHEELKYGNSVSQYICEENTLGSGALTNGIVDVRAKRLAIMNKPKFQSESHRLGSEDKVNKPSRNFTNIRQAMHEAAQRRLQDSKSCSSVKRDQGDEPLDQELQIIDLDENENGGDESKRSEGIMRSDGIVGSDESNENEDEIRVIVKDTVRKETLSSSILRLENLLVKNVESLDGEHSSSVIDLTKENDNVFISSEEIIVID